MTYQGFQIILPANMTKEKPYVWLQLNGRYYVELGNSKVGALIRIDNFLEHMDKHLGKLEEKLDKLMEREIAIQKELEQKESYADEIEACRKKLEAIDKQLGVEKK